MLVFRSLPWEDHIEEEYEKASDKSDFFTFEKIVELRFSKLEVFEKTLARESMELKKLFQYILNLRSRQMALVLRS